MLLIRTFITGLLLLQFFQPTLGCCLWALAVMPVNPALLRTSSIGAAVVLLDGSLPAFFKVRKLGNIKQSVRQRRGKPRARRKKMVPKMLHHCWGGRKRHQTPGVLLNCSSVSLRILIPCPKSTAHRPGLELSVQPACASSPSPDDFCCS